MKQTISLLAMIAVCAAVLSACEHPTGSGQGGPDVAPSPARPALTYYGAFTKGGSSYSAIYVMDTDGAHQAAVQVASDIAIGYNSPSWSPTGASICFTQTGTTPDAIKAIDVSFSAGLSPQGIHLRTIVGLPDTSNHIVYPYWSSTTAMGKIAYMTYNSNSSTFYVISQSGGVPTPIYTLAHGGGYCAWSSDDSRLALGRDDTPGNSGTIMIFNTSTWMPVDSIKVPGYIVGLDWSRSGMNKLAFGLTSDGGFAYYLYYCDPTTNAVPVTNGVSGWGPSWSPNNSSIVFTYWPPPELYKVTSFTSTITELNPSIGL